MSIRDYVKLIEEMNNDELMIELRKERKTIVKYAIVEKEIFKRLKEKQNV